MSEPQEPEAPEDVRKRDLIYSDPVHRINLVAFIRDHLRQAMESAGGPESFQEEWLSRVDNQVLDSFNDQSIM